MRIRQTLRTVDAPMLTATAIEIEAESMFFNVTNEWLFDLEYEHWPLTRRFLVALAEAGEIAAPFNGDAASWSLDTRSHMLMRGWYPAIPGWHHDDVDRTRPDGQPDYGEFYGRWRDPSRYMYVCVIDAADQPTWSLTEFLADGETVSVPWPVPSENPVYRYWDAHIERECDAERVMLESGRIYMFDQGSFHRAMPASSDGWRWFARLTVNPGPRAAGPKIRRQTQVYLPTTNLGW